MTEHVIRLPSGSILELDGAMRRCADGTTLIIGADERVWVLDPRAIVTVYGQRVYGPRDLAPDEHTPRFREWLAAHPEWDPLAPPSYEPYTNAECPRCGCPAGHRDDGPYEPHPLDELGALPPVDPDVHLLWCGFCGKPFDVSPAG
jgi:hypothetical protein